jgi:hypothetical protein
LRFLPVFVHELSDSLSQLTLLVKSDLVAVLEQEAKRKKNSELYVEKQKLKKRRTLKAEQSAQKLAVPAAPGSEANRDVLYEMDEPCIVTQSREWVLEYHSEAWKVQGQKLLPTMTTDSRTVRCEISTAVAGES